jgi:pyruvate formate-lyase activating enzyme-like uncharacterized protein
MKINHISTKEKKQDFLLCMNSLTDQIDARHKLKKERKKKERNLSCMTVDLIHIKGTLRGFFTLRN